MIWDFQTDVARQMVVSAQNEPTDGVNCGVPINPAVGLTESVDASVGSGEVITDSRLPMQDYFGNFSTRERSPRGLGLAPERIVQVGDCRRQVNHVELVNSI